MLRIHVWVLWHLPCFWILPHHGPPEPLRPVTRFSQVHWQVPNEFTMNLPAPSKGDATLPRSCAARPKAWASALNPKLIWWLGSVLIITQCTPKPIFLLPRPLYLHSLVPFSIPRMTLYNHSIFKLVAKAAKLRQTESPTTIIAKTLLFQYSPYENLVLSASTVRNSTQKSMQKVNWEQARN